MGERSVFLLMVALAPSAIAGCGSSQAAAGTAGDASSGADGSGNTPAEAAPGEGSSPPASDGGIAAACDDFYGALVGCRLPASKPADAGARFRQFCENQADLPGSTTDVAALEACTSAFKADCSASCGLPNAGTLEGGAPCNVGFDLQCQSGSCVQARTADGGYAMCGTCASAIAVGQPCSFTDPTSQCTPGSYCATLTPSTCVAYGAAGSACSSGALCAGDLFCSSTSHTCVAKAALGAACTSDAACAQGRACVAGSCAPQGDAGAPCTPSGSASPCGLGLECDMTTRTCVAPSVGPGGTCGPGLLCLLGSCSDGGACPAVVPDGQPCPTDDGHVCDVEAVCIVSGVCAIPGSPVCR